mmetsp:Transcript_3225/g.9688  ORF Transcript_3225/g.9688 Transcript_3225/m.9688 type:complete len:214 (+) Transcript_3225:146-787(+)
MPRGARSGPHPSLRIRLHATLRMQRFASGQIGTAATTAHFQSIHSPRDLPCGLASQSSIASATERGAQSGIAARSLSSLRPDARGRTAAWPALTVSTGLMSPASSGRRPPSAVITFSANATRPSGSGPPTLNKPLAPASTRRFVASAKSRLYVGVPIWSTGTFIASPLPSLRASWYTKFLPTCSGPYTTLVRRTRAEGSAASTAASPASFEDP